MEQCFDVRAPLAVLQFNQKAPAYAKQCECRKPKPGLLYQAAQDLDIDLTESFMVGDAARDVEAGRSVRCHTIFVGDPSTMDAGTRGRLEAFADASVPGLTQAADHILERPADTQAQAQPRLRQATPPLAAERDDRDEAPAAAEAREHTCSRCGRAITEEEMRSGSAIEKGGRHLCPACVSELRSKSLPQTDDSQSILEELQAITRALTYETFSVMNVVGAMVLVGAIGCLFKAYNLGGEPGAATHMLLWAIALQLLALTCFTLGRR